MISSAHFVALQIPTLASCAFDDLVSAAAPDQVQFLQLCVEAFTLVSCSHILMTSLSLGRYVNKDRKDIEPLALLVHPQQPLSYLERLIQSELPPLENGQPPRVHFRAEDSGEEDMPTRSREAEEKKEKEAPPYTRVCTIYLLNIHLL